jgi:hypothetical protein
VLLALVVHRADNGTCVRVHVGRTGTTCEKRSPRATL